MPPPTDSLDDRCKAAIFDVQQEIEHYKKAYVSRTRLFFVDAEVSFPTAEPYSLLMVLGAHDSVVSTSGDTVAQSSALDILASKQMLLAFSRSIINNCESIVSISYLLGEYQQRTFGLVDGMVQEFACAEDTTVSPLPWGYQYCLTEF
jgi:hypothetical protein